MNDIEIAAKDDHLHAKDAELRQSMGKANAGLVSKKNRKQELLIYGEIKRDQEKDKSQPTAHRSSQQSIW